MKKILLAIIILLFASPAWGAPTGIMPTLTGGAGGCFGCDTRAAYTSLSSLGPISVTFTNATTKASATGIGTTFSKYESFVSDTGTNAGQIFLITSVTDADNVVISPAPTDETASMTLTQVPTIAVVTSTTPATGLSTSTRTLGGTETLPVLTGGLEGLVENSDYPTNTIIVFEVSGTMDLASTTAFNYLNFNDSNVNVWGATAPAPGLEIKDGVLLIRASNAFISHLKVRPGDEHDFDDPDNVDGISQDASGGDSTNIVFDHLSVNFAIDELVQFYAASPLWTTNVTIANSLLGWPLVKSQHENGQTCEGYSNCHGMGVIIDDRAYGISVYRTAFLHVWKRTPENQSNSVQVVNTLVYNAAGDATYISQKADQSAPYYHTYRGIYRHAGSSGDDFAVEFPYTGDNPLTSDTHIYANDIVCASCDPTYASVCDGPWDDATGEWNDDNAGGSAPTEDGSENAAVSTTSLTVASALNIANPAHDDYLLDVVGAHPYYRGDPGANEGSKDWIDWELVQQFEDKDGNRINCVEKDSGSSYCDQNNEYSYCSNCSTKHEGWANLDENTRNIGEGTFPGNIGAMPTSPHTVSTGDWTNLEIWYHKLSEFVATGTHSGTPPPDSAGMGSTP